MDTQTDVTLGFSQNMPSSRSRSLSRGSRKRARNSSSSIPRGIRTNYRRRIWPKAKQGTSSYFDPFPNEMYGLLRYSQVVSLDPASGFPAGNIFRCNSINDPDFTGVGHQPYGHDTYQTIYNFYQVLESTITMTPMATTAGVYGITLTDDSTIQNDYNTIRELKTTNMSTNGARLSGQSVVQTFKHNEVWPENHANTDAPFGSNPQQQQFFHCWSEGANSTVDPGSTSFLFTITYKCKFYELKDLGQS